MQNTPGNISSPFVQEGPAIFPPKFRSSEASGSSTLLRSAFSIFVYLALGYVLLQRIVIIIVIIAIIFLHEMGHFLAMKYYNYSDVSMFFIPLMGALARGSKREVSQRQNAVILMAGPLPGIVLGLILYFIDRNSGGIYWGSISLNFISLLLIWLNILNLLPVYPLDGGQLMNRVFLDEEGFGSNVFIVISTGAVVWLAIQTKFYILLIIPVMVVLRTWSSRKYIALEKKLLGAGVNLDQHFEDLSDEDYWKIRTVIVQNMPQFADVNAGPPFHYDSKEEKISQEVETALQRNLLMDISVTEKIIVAAIWAIAIASPWLFNLESFSVEYLKRML